MKIHLQSDRHHEFYRDKNIPIPDIVGVDADVIVLAGDIDTGIRGVQWAIGQSERLAIPIIYIAGNHEFYGNKFPTLIDKMRNEADGTGVHFLERQGVTLDGYRFLGCVLWTDFSLLGSEQRQLAMYEAGNKMTDYKKIRHKTTDNRYPKLKPIDTVHDHSRSKSWLLGELETMAEDRAVIVSHMAPSIKSLMAGATDDPLSPAYASNLEGILQSNKVRLWIHGHTHFNVDYTINDTRVVSNQYGYHEVQQADGYRQDWVIEI
jgi:predicted phosphodiesterase